MARYLKDLDAAGDPVKALVIATAAFCSLANGGYEVKIGKFTTWTDLNVVGVSGSGTGKTSALRVASDIVRRVIEASNPKATSYPLQRPATLGSMEGFWDGLVK